MLKCCNLCNENLSIENFTVNKVTKDGYSNRCKSCYALTRKRTFKPKKEIIVDLNPTEKTCKACQSTLSIDNFDKCKIVKDGYENKCRSCRREERKESAIKKQELISSGEISILEKKCSMCKITKPVDSFSKDKSRGDGFETSCKKCKSLQNLNRQADPVWKIKQSEKQKEWRSNNVDKCKEQNKKYYFANKKVVNERAKMWKVNNPDKFKERMEKYIFNNKKKIQLRRKVWEKSINGRVKDIRKNANERNLEYQLTSEFIESHISSNCYYCNLKLDTARFDRIDSNLGYIESNVVPCCPICNWMKNNLSVNSFDNHIIKLLNFHKNKIYETRLPIIIYSEDTKKNYYLTLFGRYSWYRSAAKRRKIPFYLSYEEFESFWQKPCSYCGSTIDTIGLDRYDNNQGYIVSNIISCCFTCNSMKRDRTYEELIEQCQKIYNYRIVK